MTSDTRCTCVIKKAPTYDVYVQTPCGIHYNMVEAAVLKEREACAKIADETWAATQDRFGDGFNRAASTIAKKIRGTQDRTVIK